MSRRTSSRDDLFLSALDMYTLLSFLFIGVAFMASYGSEERSVLELPTPAGDAATAPVRERAKESLWVRFDATAERGRPGERCLVTVLQGAAFALHGSLSVPCWPRAFAERAPLSEELRDAVRRWLAQNPGRDPEALIACRRDNLEACARLQWVMAEHGLRPHALVQHE